MFARRINRAAGLSKDRLQNVVDGITGFVLTVLVFDVVVPPEGLAQADLAVALLAQREPLFTFLVTAAVIATFWLGHAQQMALITRIDRPLAWINFAGLAVVVVLPFTTSLLGRYLGSGLPTAIYGVNVGLIGVVGLAQWRWAARHPHLLREDVPREAVRNLTLRIALALTLTTIGIAVAFLNAWIAMAFYALAFIPFATRGLHEEHLRPN